MEDVVWTLTEHVLAMRMRQLNRECDFTISKSLPLAQRLYEDICVRGVE